MPGLLSVTRGERLSFALAEAVTARQRLQTAVRRRRIGLRWIAVASLLTWFPAALVAFPQTYPDLLLSAWISGGVLAAAVACVYGAERRARSRLRATVSRIPRLTGEQAREFLHELGSQEEAERRELMRVLMYALNRDPSELAPAPIPGGSDDAVSPATDSDEPAA